MAKRSNKSQPIPQEVLSSVLAAKKSFQKAISKIPVSDIGLSLLLAVVAFLVYWPSLKSDFVFDARKEMLEEGFITSLSNLPAVLSLKVLGMNLMLGTRPGALLYLMLNAAIWGANPFGYHLSSNLLHAANVGLLFALLLRLAKTEMGDMNRGGVLKARLAAVTVTLIFALHPVAVESVAEISFSSSLLVTFFTLLALLAATAFRPEHFRVAMLMGFVGTFCAMASVTCKESGIATALLLIMYWFLFRRSEPRQAWFLFLGVAIAVTVAFLAARFLFASPATYVGYLGGSFLSVSLTQPRLWVFMMGKLLWPAQLSVDYTLEDLNAPSTSLAWVILIIVILLQIGLAWKSRIGAMGVAIYWSGLMAVSNFIPLYHPVADRFYYLPLAGLVMQLLALLLLALKLDWGFWLASIPLVVAIAPLTFLTVNREAVFASDFALWSDTLRVNPLSARAHDGLGWALAQKGHLDDAILEYQKALEISPTSSNTYHNLGAAFIQKGEITEAMTQFQKALEINSHNLQAHIDLGDALSKQGQIDEAIVEYQKALEINPNCSPAYYDLGTALLQKGRVDEAIAQYQKALEIDPENVQILVNLGGAFTGKGQMDEAIVQYQKILTIDPRFSPAHYNLGIALLQRGQVDDAVEHFQKAVEIDPNFSQAIYDLGVALLERGDVGDAIEHFRKAVEVNPNYPQAHNTLGLVFAQQGQLDKAMAQFEEAVRLKPDYSEAQNNLVRVKAMMSQRPISK